MTEPPDDQRGDGQLEVDRHADPPSSPEPLSPLEYYGSSESAIAAGFRLATERVG